MITAANPGSVLCHSARAGVNTRRPTQASRAARMAAPIHAPRTAGASGACEVGMTNEHIICCRDMEGNL
jgi:hypothetical protein